MFYKLVFDMERIDAAIEMGTNTIFAEATNTDEIEYPNVKKGFFHNIIFSKRVIDESSWPNVEFYYSSKASNLENEYLLNVLSWPVIHKKVQREFGKLPVKGVNYLPIKLVDVVTNKVNNNYVLMYIINFIEAYDLDKSKYRHEEKDGDYYFFLPHEIFIDEKVCSEYDIFRSNKSLVEIYVSERIKTMVEENKWVGFKFRRQR